MASDFETIYKGIKENCSKYSGIEALGVSDIYHKYSYVSNSNVVVLDIEVSFKSLIEQKKQDRIDLCLYNKDTQTLQFVEAKHYSNKGIWSRTTPKVISQINRYESQIAKRKSEILKEYSEYTKILNRIFNISLLEPKYVEDKVTLLVFGFDNDQKEGKLRKEIIENAQYSGVKSYCIGEIKGVETKNLWKEAEVLKN